MSQDRPRVAGLVLAAGAGRRFGGPKALARDGDGRTWVEVRVRTLADGGCVPVLAVVGAAAEDVSRHLPQDVAAVLAEDWDEGMGASLRAGLRAVSALETPVDAVLVALVDTPGLTAGAVHRVAGSASPAVLAQAAYDGTPGHPVLLGRDHWDGVARTATGDRGARDYLAARDVRLVECADVADGRDVDHHPHSP